jgi:cytoskeleton protein RodZ
MTDVIEQSEAVELPAAGGPGKHLREARESRKLTPGQVAGQLRLQTRIIEALESDDYSSLAGSTFVQGYLRSYSRLLGLSENNIVALAQLSNVAEPSLVSSIYEGDSEVSSRDLPFRMVTFLILLVAVVGLGWWLSQHQPLPANVTPQIEQIGGGEQGLLLPDEAVPQQDVLLAGEGEAAGDAATETASTAEPGDSVEEVEPEVPVVTAPPVTTRPQAAVPVAPPALTAEMPQSLLELEYQADSWSEISDAAGRKLAYGLVPAGKRLELRGEAPFRVFLGFASGVTVYYNGVLYDHTSFQSGDMARFRLGRAEHNRPASR